MHLKAHARISVESVGQAFVAFHHGTGGTHVLSDVSVLVLQALHGQAMEVEDVVATIASEIGLDREIVAPSVRSACDELLGAELLYVT